MTDPTLYLILAIAGLAGLAMLSVAALTGWRGWLQLKQIELDRHEPRGQAGTSTTARIEIADLKERIRKLEAIAAGVDL
jgi:hypothetical protein